MYICGAGRHFVIMKVYIRFERLSDDIISRQYYDICLSYVFWTIICCGPHIFRRQLLSQLLPMRQIRMCGAHGTFLQRSMCKTRLNGHVHFTCAMCILRAQGADLLEQIPSSGVKVYKSGSTLDTFDAYIRLFTVHHIIHSTGNVRCQMDWIGHRPDRIIDPSQLDW